MPGAWTPEHRRAFEASIAARREARAAGQPRPTPRRRHRNHPVVTGEPTIAGLLSRTEFENAMASIRSEMLSGHAAIELAASPRTMEDLAERMRATALRMDDRLATMAQTPAAPQTADAQMLAAMRAINGRLTAVEGVLKAREQFDTEVLRLLRRLDSRPARVIEFRPDTKRQVEGGTPVRNQRKANGLTKRSRGTQPVQRISPITGKPRKRRSDARPLEPILGLGRPSLVDELVAEA